MNKEKMQLWATLEGLKELPNLIVCINSIGKNKRILLTMLKNGEPKPPHRSPLNRALKNYVNVNHKLYDSHFTQQVIQINSDWTIFEPPKKIAWKKRYEELKKVGVNNVGPNHPLNIFLSGMKTQYRQYKHLVEMPENRREKLRLLELLPDWQSCVYTKTEINKIKLIEMYKNGEPKPQFKTNKTLASALSYYTRKNSETYDELFCSQIPNWIMRNEYKQQLIEMAKQKQDKPTCNTLLGKAFGRYTNPNSVSYSIDFVNHIKQFCPEWLIKSVDSKKQLLIEMAKRKEPLPDKHSKLGSAFRTYTRSSSGSFDVEFKNTIMEIYPKWLEPQIVWIEKQLNPPQAKIRPEKTSTINKKIILEMAKRGEKPKGKLWAALLRYTYPSGSSYDPIFDKEIRALKPDWFERAKTQKAA